ncbi:HAD family hydrolase [Pseudoxanthomonas winnipegensis]|uniref:HAD family hydrolase n=1 Tax=Pseudoxanthomonas winnipegensis TaxID=2480810 RepID=UPI0013EEA92F|nr:HAD family phosphatase [Pseudoxanthomonas winnipegensis]
MIKAILVDLDGTLVDTHAANLAAYRVALEEEGLVYDQATLERVVGRLAWRSMLQEVLPDHPYAHARVAERKRRLYADMASQVLVNQELVELLQLLRPSVRIALVTAASPGSVGPLLQAKGLDTLFSVIVTSADVEQQKPDPQPFQRAAQLLGVSAAECLILEDSDVGLAAAHAFGAQVWKVEWANRR